MAKLDRLKEELGWFRAIFTITIVTDISLIAWLVQHYTDTQKQLFVGCLITIVIVTGAVVILNRLAYQILNELEEL